MADKLLRVVSAVIRKGDTYLITQRRETASLPLLWEFPGGRVEPGETDADALRREIRERLNVEISVDKPVAFRRHDYEGYSVELVLYEAELAEQGIEAVGVREYRWVPAEEFSKYAFPPADRQALDDYQLLVGQTKQRKLPQA